MPLTREGDERGIAAQDVFLQPSIQKDPELSPGRLGLDSFLREGDHLVEQIVVLTPMTLDGGIMNARHPSLFQGEMFPGVSKQFHESIFEDHGSFVFPERTDEAEDANVLIVDFRDSDR